MIRFALPVLICASLSGCLSQMAAREDSGSLGIRWQEDFDAACRAAAACGRPILVVMVAGDLRDKC
jgi:hypothetical protein